MVFSRRAKELGFEVVKKADCDNKMSANDILLSVRHFVVTGRIELARVGIQQTEVD
jgi:hypothetical protein